MNIYPWIYFYLLAMNIVAFFLMSNDKARARKRERRIPEKNLFITAWLGGSLGMLLGMQIFRHKTKHRAFTLGIPMILLIQIGLVLYWYYAIK
ncbi:DUF1294 domain-containing protein [Enterococcus sp.]|uniref:DUF1294 domain-containing protein n=1 Tax=Enterococcus sp. TaxID=35783 RepID=UPI002FCC2093